MIIKSTRVKVGGATKLGAHLMKRDENEAIVILSGDTQMLLDGDALAQGFSRSYGNRHFIISPDQPLSQEQLKQTLKRIQSEFGINPEDGEFLVQHQKKRADGTSVAHYHYCVSETRNDGKALDSSWTKIRQERISRELEFAFDHKITHGRFSKLIIRNAAMNRQMDFAKKLYATFPEERPRESFSAKKHQEAKRLGIDLPRSRQIVADVWAHCEDWESFRAALNEHSLLVEQGRRTWIIKDDVGNEIGSLARLTKAKNSSIEQRLNYRNDTAPKF